MSISITSAEERLREAQSSARDDLIAIKRQQILDAASLLFFEKGYDASTVEMLAKRLNVTKPYIYTYFENKGAILAAICETGIRESIAAVDAAVAAGKRPVDQLRAAVAGAARVVIRFQKSVVIYQREMKALDRRDAQRILQMRHHFDRQLIRILEQAHAQDEVDVPDPGMTSVWIGGLLSWIPTWYLPGGRRGEGEVVEELVTAVLRLVLARDLRSAG